jgi:hypothetical protein
MDGDMSIGKANGTGDTWKEIPVTLGAEPSLEMAWNADQIFHAQFPRQLDIPICKMQIPGQRLVFCLAKEMVNALFRDELSLYLIGPMPSAHNECLGIKYQT